MSHISIYVLLFFIFFSQVFFSPKDFIEALIHNSPDIQSSIDESELSRSQRLDINYVGVKNKFLISYDIEEEMGYCDKKKCREIKCADAVKQRC